MARGGFPSMTALLGLVAVAGYQNRDKLSEMMGGASGGQARAGAGGSIGDALGGLLGGGQGGRSSGGLGGLLGSLGGGAAGGGLGGLLGGGLGEMSDRFRQNGQGDAVDSWVGTGPNRAVTPHDIEQGIGPDTIEDLMEHTGLPRDELLARLSRELPKAVDQYTPHGRVPNDDDLRNWQG